MIVHEPSVQLIDSMGSDLSIVNAARVSFDKVSHEFTEKDEGLIRYLAKHGHWSPFAHTSLQFRCTAPIFLARQLVKHQVGGVWNEVSRRYVDYTPDFYVPKRVHTRPVNAKQGCGAEIPDDIYIDAITTNCLESLYVYDGMINDGVAPEEARMVLPLNTMTEWIWTGSLMFWYRVWKQRSDAHAQLVAQEFARMIDVAISNSTYAKSWAILKENSNG